MSVENQRSLIFLIDVFYCSICSSSTTNYYELKLLSQTSLISSLLYTTCNYRPTLPISCDHGRTPTTLLHHLADLLLFPELISSKWYILLLSLSSPAGDTKVKNPDDLSADTMAK